MCAGIYTAGVWRPDGNCYYGRDKSNWRASTYSCACATIAQPLEWQASASCVSSSGLGASTGPAVCRFRKHGSPGTFTMGWITGNTCTSPVVPFGPNGSPVSVIEGIGGPTYNFQVIRPAYARKFLAHLRCKHWLQGSSHKGVCLALPTANLVVPATMP